MKPLSGQRVIDLTQNVAGPYCTQILADLGADVIKIERPGAGDDTRCWTPQVGEGISATYATLNRGKRSLALDLDHADGQALVRRLLRPGDIVIHSLKPGSAEQRGLGYDDLRAVCPGLIYCALSAFGNIGPLSGLPGYDPLIQAFAGIMSVNGHDGQPPARVGVSMVDMGAGLWSVIGILAAVARRKDDGQGARIDTSLLETGVAWMTNPIANYSASGKLPRRMGSATAMLAPYEVFETSDAHVFIGCGADRMFQKLAAALENKALAEDPRFARNADRVANREALHEAIATLTRAQTTQQVVDRLRAAGVPVSAVNDLSRLLQDPQVQALALHAPLPLDAARGLVAVGTPIRFDGERSHQPHLSPRVGQDTRDVLESAGLRPDEIDTLAQKGAVQL
ncbi:CaiB/BaiF CoA transferase family protein [Ramlibacter sp. Leaf400]|uniref:CaiB/BaiF CoA transferase family protein n=1 Tax=Ramlibacter sp. Leaf400 TaxID=1736365 RepID=UPI0006FABDD1|nr:CaiB/BaiF CoA-transferase family protein [Ramlibacter sp. Leaf400]KQT13887.1 formyl-CoA transferase [Ramlibacter sp. Leaf400]